MDENADASQATFEAPPPENWRRPPGRPRTTWMKNIHNDLPSLDLGIHEARDLAQNQPLCRHKNVSWMVKWNWHASSVWQVWWRSHDERARRGKLRMFLIVFHWFIYSLFLLVTVGVALWVFLPHLLPVMASFSPETFLVATCSSFKLMSTYVFKTGS